MKILVIDDEEHILLIMQPELTDEGYDVITVVDGGRTKVTN